MFRIKCTIFHPKLTNNEIYYLKAQEFKPVLCFDCVRIVSGWNWKKKERNIKKRTR